MMAASTYNPPTVAVNRRKIGLGIRKGFQVYADHTKLADSKNNQPQIAKHLWVLYRDTKQRIA